MTILGNSCLIYWSYRMCLLRVMENSSRSRRNILLQYNKVVWSAWSFSAIKIFYQRVICGRAKHLKGKGVYHRDISERDSVSSGEIEKNPSFGRVPPVKRGAGNGSSWASWRDFFTLFWEKRSPLGRLWHGRRASEQGISGSLVFYYDWNLSSLSGNTYDRGLCKSYSF